MSSLGRHALRFAAIGALLAVAAGLSSAHAQTNVQLALTGGSVLFDSPTAADMVAGAIEASAPLSFEVTTASEPPESFTTTVLIRGSSATLGNGKPIGDLEWRRGDETTWHALSTTDAIVEQRVTSGTPQGHTWDNTIFFRVTLRWTNAPPGSYSSNFVITITTTTP